MLYANLIDYNTVDRILIMRNG